MLRRRARQCSDCSAQRLNGQQLGLPGSQVLEAEVVLVDGGSGDLLGFLRAQGETRWAKSGGSARERAGAQTCTEERIQSSVRASCTSGPCETVGTHNPVPAEWSACTRGVWEDAAACTAGGAITSRTGDRATASWPENIADQCRHTVRRAPLLSNFEGGEFSFNAHKKRKSGKDEKGGKKSLPVSLLRRPSAATRPLRTAVARNRNFQQARTLTPQGLPSIRPAAAAEHGAGVADGCSSGSKPTGHGVLRPVSAYI